jgi:hypothetical protein
MSTVYDMSSAVDPFLLSKKEEFEAGLQLLDSADPTGAAQLAKLLCELSRDIRLRLGPPCEASPQLVSELVQVFRKGAQAIHGDPVEPEVMRYRENILRRAEKLEAAVTGHFT